MFIVEGLNRCLFLFVSTVSGTMLGHHPAYHVPIFFICMFTGLKVCPGSGLEHIE